MSQNLNTEFEVMPMPRKDAPQLFGGSYRVYKSPRDYIVVSADSALSALQLSGLESAYKIERESMDNISVLSAASWGGRESEPAQVVMEANAEMPKSEPADTVLLDVPEKPDSKAASADSSSNDDVEKLLNS